jgi:hypothetical protein
MISTKNQIKERIKEYFYWIKEIYLPKPIKNSGLFFVLRTR